MKKYANLILILISFMLFGCNTSNSEEAEQVPTSGEIIVHSNKYEMIPGNYVSKGEPEIHSVDTPSVLELSKEFETLTVNNNSSIEIIIKENPSLTVFEWNEDEQTKEVAFKDNKINVPEKEGVYIYEVKAKWENGEASFIFDVEVK
ncbi:MULTISPECIES: hypothetical protein [Virgibacillus]|uniref:Lipoprotein n=1 Tax=Virgibacillus dokdonensis TaxID=302167 RepID=A0ABU7VG95_9BACI|nr:hypothetical protein [Virgibacillus sp.]NWO14643.1 hypothetical protein [Virgibacillus sp.]